MKMTTKTVRKSSYEILDQNVKQGKYYFQKSKELFSDKKVVRKSGNMGRFLGQCTKLTLERAVTC